MEGDVVKDASFVGSGCAISTASASLMTESLKGKTRDEALKLLDKFHDLLTTDTPVEQGPGQAGGLLRRARLSGAREMRHAGLAHAEIGAERRGRTPVDYRTNELSKDQVIAALKKVYDPEMPVNIYELGLIYGCDVDAAGQVVVRMTLTAPNCPVAGSLPARSGAGGARGPGRHRREAGTGLRSAVVQGPHVGSRQAGAGHRRHHSDREAATMKLTANEEYGLRCLVRLATPAMPGRASPFPKSARRKASRRPMPPRSCACCARADS